MVYLILLFLLPFQLSSAPLKGGNKQNKTLVFTLEAAVHGPSILYPGQRTRLIYTISFNRNIDLAESTLPFIHPAGLQKIGDAHITEEQRGEISIQNIEQEVEARKAGRFLLGPSSLRGYTYVIDPAGKKWYNPRLLTVQVPAVELLVKPFPANTEPASFTGSLGKVVAAIKPLTSIGAARLGEELKFLLELSGLENLEDVRLPHLLCQPGLSGLFELGTTPLSGVVRENRKQFALVLKPVSLSASEIPSLEFSSFDPLAGTYSYAHTEPFPMKLEIAPIAPPPIATGADSFYSLLDQLFNQPTLPFNLKIPLPSLASCQQPLLETPWTLWIIPIWICALACARTKKSIDKIES